MRCELTPAYRANALAAYQMLHTSEALERAKQDAPILVAVVYWTVGGDDPEDVRRELRRMRETGLTAVRLHNIDPVETAPGEYDFSYPDLLITMAREAGLQVFPHFALCTPDSRVLAEHGLDPSDLRRLGLSDSRVADAVRVYAKRIIDHYADESGISGWSCGGGESAPENLTLQDDLDRERFMAWLDAQYGSPDALHAAWAMYPAPREGVRLPPECIRIRTWEDAVDVVDRLARTEKGPVMAGTLLATKLYGPVRDLARFRADRTAQAAQTMAGILRKLAPGKLLRTGSHQLMLNHARAGWDIAALARAGDWHCTSIHMSWHFEAVEGEIDRPVLMQARMTSDLIKGGVGSPFETTGGPVQYSGGYGNHMDAGLMRRLMLSYLATGNKSVGFWTWNPRPGGWEAGEYGMLTLSGKVSPWAKEAGRIAQAMETYRHELWNAWEPPELGILRSWETEAILACEPDRHDLKDLPGGFTNGTQLQHMRALVGASRAAMNHHIAYEYVFEQEILCGIAGVYPAIYCPHVRACSDALLEKLLTYVEAGGRLIVDVQFALLDPWGKVRPRGEGTLLDRLCGGWVDSIHDARGNPRQVGAVAITSGFYGDVEMTRGHGIAAFEDGSPAVMETSVGKGSVVTIAFDPAHMCHRPGCTAVEDALARWYRGELRAALRDRRAALLPALRPGGRSLVPDE